jgi:hypothetical protein
VPSPESCGEVDGCLLRFFGGLGSFFLSVMGCVKL